MLGETQSSLQNAYAYPVPFRPNSDPSHKHITFTGLSAQTTIKIYTITGELVATIHESDGDGMCIWDARGAASGMYIYRIDNNREHKTGHLLIVK